MIIDVSRLRDLALNDLGFVFDPLTGHTFTVNATGLAVMRALKQSPALEAALSLVAAAFEIDAGDDLARDVDEFLARLREQGLVR